MNTPTTISITNPDVLLVNHVRGAPGTRGKEAIDIPYADTVAPSYLKGLFHQTFPAEPVYFLQLGGTLRAEGITVEILDGFCHKLLPEELSSVALQFDSKIYCIEVFHNTLQDGLSFARQLKLQNNNAVTVFGGAYATRFWKELAAYAEVDYVVVGDGELALLKLARNILKSADTLNIAGVAYFIDGNSVLNPPIPIQDLSSLAWPIRDLLPAIKELNHGVSMYTSRGCAYGKCSFCYLIDYQSKSNQPLWRARSAEDVVAEMKMLSENFGVRRITFVDEDYLGPPNEGVERALRIADLLIREKIQVNYYINALVRGLRQLLMDGRIARLVESGLDSVFVGFESTSAIRLKQYHKPQRPEWYDELIAGLIEHKVRINPGLITFDPDTTVEELSSNLCLAQSMRYYDLFFFTRSLVDLDQNPFLESTPTNASSTSLLEVARSEHDDVVRRFAEKPVGLVFQTLRIYLHHVLPIYKSVCASAPVLPESTRASIIEHHYMVANQAILDNAEGRYRSFEYLESWVTPVVESLQNVIQEVTFRERMPPAVPSWS